MSAWLQRTCTRSVTAGALLLTALACGRTANNDRNSDTASKTSSGTNSETASSTLRAAVPTDSAAQVVVQYYDAIQRRDFTAAFAFWSGGGRASGQTRNRFAAGFAQTARVDATIAGPVTVEGAAGSQYATVPVKVDTRLLNGKEQHFAGSYVLRRSMVDGATEEQRRWRIYSANIRPR